MVFKQTILNPVDKCGVWVVKTFHLYRGSKRRGLGTGGFLKVSVRKTRPNNKILKKTKSKAVVVRTRFRNLRLDGSYVKFKSNSCVLLKKRMTPRGRELYGPVSRNVRRKKFMSTFVSIL